MSDLTAIRQLIAEVAPCERCEQMQTHNEKMGAMLDQSRAEVERLNNLIDKKNQELQALTCIVHLHKMRAAA